MTPRMHHIAYITTKPQSIVLKGNDLNNKKNNENKDLKIEHENFIW
jgi:hypothetical protein